MMTFFAKSFAELTSAELYEILKARSEVFVLEENIRYQDMDDVDYRALHCFIVGGGKVAAYLRAYRDLDDAGAVRIGRVLTTTHGAGVGRALMTQSLAAIWERSPCDKVCMDSQSHAIGFYKRFGFTVTTAEFLEEGVPHVGMELARPA